MTKERNLLAEADFLLDSLFRWAPQEQKEALNTWSHAYFDLLNESASRTLPEDQAP
jgi:hypothetical protein